MAWVQQEGVFRGTVLDYAIKQGKDETGKPTASLGINLNCSIDEILHKGEWADYREYGLEVSGYLNFVKKNGETNDDTVRKFMEATGWDGNLEDLATKLIRLPDIQFSVKVNVYNGNTTYQINNVYGFDAERGAGPALDQSQARSLQSQYGSQFRAMASNAKTNGTKPAGKPAAPPKKPAPQKGDDAPFVGSQTDQNEVPF